MVNRVGRLIEARVNALRTPADADAYARALRELVVKLGEPPVLCADHRPVAIYPQAVADRLGELFVQMNTRLVRVAILVARTNATLSMQLERIVREARSPHRRVFYDAEPALDHLAPALDAHELVAARVFLESERPRSEVS